MNICSIYARANGVIAHVADGTFPLTPDAGTTLVIQFAIDSYPDEYQHIANNSKAAFWDGANLQIDSVVYLDSTWIAARQVELTQVEAVASVQANAKTQAAAIPNWAGWSEAQVLAWFDTNITAGLPAANLAAANVVLSNMATAQRAMARMIVAMRNELWSDMQGE